MFDWLFGRSSERVDKILEANRNPPERKTYNYDPDRRRLMFDWLFGRSSERVDKILEANRNPPEWKTYNYDPDIGRLTRERNLAVSTLKKIARNDENFDKEGLMQLANYILQEMVK